MALLNLDTFPDNMISGLTADEIKKHVQLSTMTDLAEQLMFEDDPADTARTLDELFNLMPMGEDELESGFRLESEVEAMQQEASSSRQLESIVDLQHEETKIMSTERHEVMAVNKFRRFLAEFNFKSFNVQTCSMEELATKLKYFYATLRKEDGQFYAPTSLICFRAGLFRFFMRTRAMNIIESDAFHLANLALKAVCRLFLKAGGRLRHFEAIEKDDMAKLWRYFDRSSGTKLLHEVYFVLLFYSGQRGREWLRGLTPESLLFEDVGGVQTVRLQGGLQKTIGTKLSVASMEDNKEAVIKSTGGDHCPVSAIKLYLEKRNDSHSGAVRKCEPQPLFVMPSTAQNAKHWYTAKPVGVNTLATMMKRISEGAQLSKVYTAHIVRPTVISELHEAGFRLEQICKITGHKDTKTVQRYLTNGKRRAIEMTTMSDALSSSLYGMSSSSNSVDKSSLLTVSTKFEELQVASPQFELPVSTLPVAAVAEDVAVAGSNTTVQNVMNNMTGTRFSGQIYANSYKELLHLRRVQPWTRHTIFSS